jgi:hypothetical protein
MAWSFRRSLNLGPFRVNLSKKGAGVSVGARGFRIGRDGQGRQYTQTSIPGTGIYRRDYYSGAPPQPTAPHPPKANRSPYLPSKYFWLLTTLAVVLWIALKLLK